jgi:hypothetical protein
MRPFCHSDTRLCLNQAFFKFQIYLKDAIVPFPFLSSSKMHWSKSTITFFGYQSSLLFFVFQLPSKLMHHRYLSILGIISTNCFTLFTLSVAIFFNWYIFKHNIILQDSSVSMLMVDLHLQEIEKKYCFQYLAYLKELHL